MVYNSSSAIVELKYRKRALSLDNYGRQLYWQRPIQQKDQYEECDKKTCVKVTLLNDFEYSNLLCQIYLDW